MQVRCEDVPAAPRDEVRPSAEPRAAGNGGHEPTVWPLVPPARHGRARTGWPLGTERTCRLKESDPLVTASTPVGPDSLAAGM